MRSLAKRILTAGAMMLIPLASASAQTLAVPSPAVVQAQAPAGPMELGSPVFVDNAAPAAGGYAVVDALIWTRTMTSGPVFINNTNAASLINTKDIMRFDWNAAPRVTLGAGLGDGLAAEISWFGFYDFRARGNSGLDANSAPLAALPFNGIPLLAFDAGDTQTYEYRSRLTNTEFNVRQQVNDNWNIMAGFRYLNLAEQFNGNLFRTDGSLFGTYGVRTENNLWGGQVGADYSGMISDRLRLTATSKFGIFGGAENQTTSGSFFSQGPDIIIPGFIIPGRIPIVVPAQAVPGPLLPAERRASACQFAYLAELGVNLTYQVSDRVALRGGYNLLWVEGVALAPNQFTTSNFAPGGAGAIHTRGGMLMHGAVAGLEFRW